MRRRARRPTLNGTDSSAKTEARSGSTTSSFAHTGRDRLVRNSFSQRHVLRGTPTTLFNRFTGRFFEATCDTGTDPAQHTTLAGDDCFFKRRRAGQALSKIRDDGPRGTSCPGCVQCALGGLRLIEPLSAELIEELLVRLGTNLRTLLDRPDTLCGSYTGSCPRCTRCGSLSPLGKGSLCCGTRNRCAETKRRKHCRDRLYNRTTQQGWISNRSFERFHERGGLPALLGFLNTFRELLLSSPQAGRLHLFRALLCTLA